jgi:hypothetical protein
VERKGTAKVIVSYDVEKTSAASMGINSLRESRLGFCSEHCVLEKVGAIFRVVLKMAKEDLEPDAEMEAILYVI